MRFLSLCSALLVALTRFQVEGAFASMLELEDAVQPLNVKAIEWAHSRAVRLVGSNDSSIDTLRTLMYYIRSYLVLSPENAELFKLTVDKLTRAERSARSEAERSNRSAAMRHIGYGPSPKMGLVSHDVRSEIKATLAQIFKNSELRVPLIAPQRQRAVVVDPSSRPIRPYMDRSDLPILSGGAEPRVETRIRQAIQEALDLGNFEDAQFLIQALARLTAM